MSDLHAALLAAVQERRRLADEAYRYLDAEWAYIADLVGTKLGANFAAPFIAAETPSFVIDQCNRDLKVLERHQQNTLGGAPLSTWDECRCVNQWPCVEIVDMATAYGIPVTTSTEEAGE